MVFKYQYKTWCSAENLIEIFVDLILQNLRFRQNRYIT